MAHVSLVLGDTGNGKSHSTKTLPPKETFYVNVANKELPYRGSQKLYTKLTSKSGNMLVSDDYALINKALEYINNIAKSIKYFIVDDSQYLIINEFMRKHSTQGKGNSVFDLYNKMADNFWGLINTAKDCRDDLQIFFLHHTEMGEDGKIKAKTIGKLLDEKVNIPGMFNVVFYAVREGKNNYFYTQNDGTNPAKTPDGMFEDEKIPNDLMYVASKILPYYKGE